MKGKDQLFYTKSVNLEELQLEDQEAVHCSLVLRKKPGDIIYAADGLGSIFKAGIDKVSKRAVLCTVIEKDFRERTELLNLAVAPTKNRDRLEWMIEKVVEIGVKSLIFMDTHQTERAKINLERCEKKALSAMKQSLRYYLPEIKTMSFEAVLTLDAEHKYIAHCFDEKDKTTNTGNRDSLVLIGPEGDFTEDELLKAKTAHFKTLDLGDYRLRTETAAIVATALFNQH